MQTIDKIFVEQDDEIIFVVEKVLSSPTSRVILVIPASSNVESSVISLKLLSRQILESNKLVIMVSDNPTAKRLAAKANLVVRDKISMVDKLAWDEALAIKTELRDHKSAIKKELLASRIPEELPEEIEDLPEEVAELPETKDEEEVDEIETEVAAPPVAPISVPTVMPEDPVEAAPEKQLFAEKPRLAPKVVEVGGISLVAGGDIQQLAATNSSAVATVAATAVDAKAVNSADSADIEATAAAVKAKTEKLTADAKTSVTGFIGNIKEKVGDQSKVLERRLKTSEAKEGKTKSPRKKVVKILALVVVILLLLVVGFFAFSYFVMAKAEIDVAFNQSEGTFSKTITVSSLATSIDSTNLVIPAKEITVEESASGDGVSTGKKEGGEYAQGVIDIRNKSTESAVNLSAGQIVVDISSNLQYEIVQNTAIPVDEYKRDVQIKAKAFGEEYNIEDEQSTFRIEGFTTDQLIGFGFRDITGGSTEEITVVAASDVAKVKTGLEETLKGNLRSRLKSQLGEGEVLLEGSEKYNEVGFSQSVKNDEEAENFSADLKMNVIAFKVSEADIKELAEEIIKETESATSEAEIMVDDFDITNVKLTGDKVTFDLSASGEVNENLNLEEQKAQIAGKSLSEAETYLESLDQIDQVTITYSPGYIPETLRKIPRNTGNIEFN